MSHQPSKSNEDAVWSLYIEHLESLMQEAEMAVRYEVKDKEAYYERLRIGSRALHDAICTTLQAKDADIERVREEERKRIIEIIKDELRNAPLEVQITKGVIFANVINRITPNISNDK